MKRTSKEIVENIHKIVMAKNGKTSISVEDYKNCNTKFEITCCKGHVWKENAVHLEDGRWCPECRKNPRIKYDDVLLEAKKRNGKCLTKKEDFKNGKENLEWECHAGHTFKKSMDKIRGRNQWCPKCSTKYKSENLCRFYIEEIFGEEFPKYRAKWLISPNGGRMELDGFCEKLNIAFEYNGLQHYKSVSLFNKEKSLEDIQQYDEHKLNLCKEKGIATIIIPTLHSKIKMKDLKSEIYKQINNLNLTPKIKEEDLHIDLKKTPSNTHADDQLLEAHRIAAIKGWKCLSDRYINCYIPLKWQCKYGHIFELKIGKARTLNRGCKNALKK